LFFQHIKIIFSHYQEVVSAWETIYKAQKKSFLTEALVVVSMLVIAF